LNAGHLLWYPGHELLLGDVTRAEGSCVYDSKGERYVDLELRIANQDLEMFLETLSEILTESGPKDTV